MIGVGWRGCPPLNSVTPGRTPARQQAGEGGDPDADDEARDGRADDHLALVRAQLCLPVRRLDDLAAQLLDGDRQLGAVGLDRLPDLFRASLGQFTFSTTPVAGVAGCESVIVALISLPSSIAICGVGGEPLRKKRA